MSDNCGCFEETIYHKILDIGHKYYLMQEDKNQEDFLKKLRKDKSVSCQRIVAIMAYCFDEYDLYLSKKGLPRNHFKSH